ncbi:cell filamentation protein Fic [Xenorhabdus sp. 12]|uniref:protein adenylyltransferase n=1 Tax=Xenorhabdus santafensis TaxID=2582833 RepID=A0ABU4S826_9GAMM|nr:Fic family protein [Xenorhabdus sp. 12]MDX7986921.1 cell filamentation protein Fic [Xenorhabdus sp. 12]
MDKYLTTYGDPYCYKGTNVLINLFNIQDITILEGLESELTAKASEQINFRDPPYSLQTMKEIHQTLFGDIYEWAGELRRCDIIKEETRFCNASFLESEAKRLFSALEKDQWLSGLMWEPFCEKLAEHYCEFNMLHPFREGNGRTQRILFDFIANYNDYTIEWSEIERDEWLCANRRGVGMNYDMMTELFKRAVAY